MGWRTAAALIAAGLLVSCSTGSEDVVDGAPELAGPGVESETAEVDRGTVDVAPLRQTFVDFEPTSSPQHLAESALHDAIVRGRLRTVLPGGGRSPSEEDDSPEQYVILALDIEEVYVTSRDIGLDDTAYVVLFQGAWRDGQPEYSLDDWNQALPSGTEMMLFLHRTNVGMVTGKHGIPPDVIGMTPLPQGLILRDGNGLLGGLVDLHPGWTELSWDELEAQVADATQ